MASSVRRPFRRFRPRLVHLEDRVTPTTFIVNTLVDENDGIGVGGVSLREALAAANANGTGADIIDFQPGLTGTIQLTAALPTINSDLMVTGPGAANLAVRRDTGGNYRIFDVGARDVTIQGLTLTNGFVNGNGGGIQNVGRLTLIDCDVLDNHTNNAGVRGGGLHNGAAGTVVLIDCNFVGNTATTDGMISNAGTLTVVGSTFRDTTQFSVGGLGNTGTAVLINSTFANLVASSGAGAISNSGTLTVRNSTITNNTTNGPGASGGIVNAAGGTVALYNTVVSDNFNPGSRDLRGAFSGSGNVIGFGTYTGLSSSNNKVGVAALLSPVGNYGGRTWTSAILPGSPAIDAGLDAEALDATGAPLNVDQRGVSRPVLGAVDAGAFESRGFTLSVVGGDNQSAQISTSFSSQLRVAVTANAPGEPVDGGYVTFDAPSSGPSLAFEFSSLIGAGEAALGVQANLIVGSYEVVASAAGAPSVGFHLTNIPPVVTLSTLLATANENTGAPAMFGVTRVAIGATFTVRLDLAGTASPADYNLSLQSSSGLSFSRVDADTIDVTFFGGIPQNAAQMAVIVVTPVNDAHAEADETVVLTAVDLAGYDVATPGSATATILQNDFVVVNTNESGEGSLAQAILNANALAGADTITFQTTGTILLGNTLPAITEAVTITGPGADDLTLQRSSADSYRLLRIQAAGAPVAISGLTFRGRPEQGRTLMEVDDGSVTVSDCVFADNAAVGGGSAGAIRLDAGSLTVIRCTFSNNSAEGGGAGGAISAGLSDSVLTVVGSTFTGNDAFGGSAGGAITTRGIAHISDSLFASNTATGSAAGAIFLSGGGSITNTTIHDNRSAWDGGGVIVGFDETATITHSTITGNVADEAGTGFGMGGGLRGYTGATITVVNSIVAGNFDTPNNAGPQTNPTEAHPDVSGVFLDGGGNLIGVGQGATGFTVSMLIGTLASPLDPGLAPLADNGGPTLTRALLPGSLALDAAIASAVLADQRGVARPQGAGSDIGAFELDSAPPVVTLEATDTTADELPSGGAGLYTLTRTGNLADPLTVTVTITGSAGVGTDYVLGFPQGTSAFSVSGNTVTLTFAPGADTATFGLFVLGDVHAEADEMATLSLDPGTGYQVGAVTQGTVTIAQNDFVVINTNESGEGSLAQAILNANALAGADTITFQTSGTIPLTGPLPAVTSPVIITGPGIANLTLQRTGSGSFSLLLVNGAVPVSVSGLTFRGAAVEGGPLVDSVFGNLTVIDCLFADNVAQFAGAIRQYNGSLTVTRSTFSNNTATGGGAGGAINFNATHLSVVDSVFTGNRGAGSGSAGALAVSSGFADVSRSTFLNNEVTGNVAGGAIWCSNFFQVRDSVFAYNAATGAAAGAIYVTGGGSLVNCTLHANRSTQTGGGIVVDAEGTVTLDHCTITGNLADEASTGFGAGGGLAVYNSDVIVTNSIVAGNFDTPNNSGPQTGPALAIPDVLGGVTDGGGNLIGVVEGSGGFTVSTLLGTLASPLDPSLAPLGDYGGPTLTRALLVSSPAFDAAIASTVDFDQRGIARPQGGGSDIGAFESRGFTLTRVSGEGQSATVGTAFANPLVARLVANDVNVPVDGVQVTFAGPATGAGLVSTTATATTLGDGTASVGVVANATAGSYVVEATLAGVAAPVSFALTNTPAGTTCEIIGYQIDDGNPQRSMVRSITLTFSSALSSAQVTELLANLTLTRLGGLTGTLSLRGTLLAGGTQLKLTFTGTSVFGGSLADGRYELKCGGETVIDSTKLFRLFGDVSGDGQVDDINDQPAMTLAMNTRRGLSARYNQYLDFGQDGAIINSDQTEFGKRKGKKLSADGSIVPI